MNETTIQVDDLSKKFARTIRHAMVYGLGDIARAALIPHSFRSEGLAQRMADAEGSADPVSTVRFSPHDVQAAHEQDKDGLRTGEFWALRHLSFRIRRGECVGLVGANGAGKSTIFSILSGIYGPTSGRAMIRGRLQALIALGAGFHPMLSGRENIYINAAILGLRTREIDAKLESIIAFSEIGEFIDAPIRTYSSGMLVRLGFSVAAHMDPDVLLIDEVLAVGDAAFQAKCQTFSTQLANSGKTIIIVTHNMIVVQGMCSRAIWLHRGRLVEDGETDGVVRRYKDFQLTAALAATKQQARIGLVLLIRDMRVLASGLPDRSIPVRHAFTVRIELYAIQQVSGARAWVDVLDVATGTSLAGCRMFEDELAMALQPGRHVLDVEIEGIPLAPGRTYRVAAGVRDWTGQILIAESYASPPLTAIALEHTSKEFMEKGVFVSKESSLAVAHAWHSDSGITLTTSIVV